MVCGFVSDGEVAVGCKSFCKQCCSTVESIIALFIYTRPGKTCFLLKSPCGMQICLCACIIIGLVLAPLCGRTLKPWTGDLPVKNKENLMK